MSRRGCLTHAVVQIHGGGAVLSAELPGSDCLARDTLTMQFAETALSLRRPSTIVEFIIDSDQQRDLARSGIGMRTTITDSQPFIGHPGSATVMPRSASPVVPMDALAEMAPESERE